MEPPFPGDTSGNAGVGPYPRRVARSRVIGARQIIVLMRRQFEATYGASVQVIGRLHAQQWGGDSVMDMSRFMSHWRKHVSALTQECGPDGRKAISVDGLRDLLFSKLEHSDVLQNDPRNLLHVISVCPPQQGYDTLMQILDRNINLDLSREVSRTPPGDDPLKRPARGPTDRHALLATPTADDGDGDGDYESR